MSLNHEGLSYSVEITQDGRGGWDYYTEQNQRLPFEWDFSSKGVVIDVPSPGDWNSYCRQHNAAWAEDRRHEILTRLAEGVREQKAKGATIRIDENSIHLDFQDSRLASFLVRVVETLFRD